MCQLWNPSIFKCEYDKTCEIAEHLDIKNFTCKKPVIDNLVFTCEDEIINTTETTLKNYLDKKVITKKRSLPYSQYFISNYTSIFVSIHFL